MIIREYLRCVCVVSILRNKTSESSNHNKALLRMTLSQVIIKILNLLATYKWTKELLLWHQGRGKRTGSSRRRVLFYERVGVIRCIGVNNRDILNCRGP